MCVRFYWSAAYGAVAQDRRQWMPSLEWHADSTVLPIDQAPASSITDDGRDWIAQTQDIAIDFARAMTDASLSSGMAATGWSAKLNGTPTALTYRSGSGSNAWVLRIGALVRNGDALTVSYDPSSGNTRDPDGNEQVPLTDLPATNSLTKRVRFTLKDKSDVAVANTSVMLAIAAYASANPSDANWLQRSDSATLMTDGNGLVDAAYSGSANVGDTVYVATLHPAAAPAQSMLWTSAVQ